MASCSSTPAFSFPNLTRLELGSLEYFGLFANTFVELAKTVPNLKHISLSAMQSQEYYNGNSAPVEDVLETISSSGLHTKIESLSLIFHNSINSSLIQSLKLRAVFPSLKCLDVTMAIPDWIDGTEPESELWERIECLNNWRSLTQLTEIDGVASR